MIKQDELIRQQTHPGTAKVTCVGVAEVVDAEQLVVPSRQETAAVLRREAREL